MANRQTLMSKPVNHKLLRSVWTFSTAMLTVMECLKMRKMALKQWRLKGQNRFKRLYPLKWKQIAPLWLLPASTYLIVHKFQCYNNNMENSFNAKAQRAKKEMRRELIRAPGRVCYSFLNDFCSSLSVYSRQLKPLLYWGTNTNMENTAQKLSFQWPSFSWHSHQNSLTLWMKIPVPGVLSSLIFLLVPCYRVAIICSKQTLPFDFSVGKEIVVSVWHRRRPKLMSLESVSHWSREHGKNIRLCMGKFMICSIL